MNNHICGTLTVGFGRADSKDIDFFFSEEDSYENNLHAVFKLLNIVLDMFLENNKIDAIDHMFSSKLELIFKPMARVFSPLVERTLAELEERKYDYKILKTKINALNNAYSYENWLSGKDWYFANIVITAEYMR